MKSVFKAGYVDGMNGFLVLSNRGCIKCGRTDLLQDKTMRIKAGFLIWNILFSMMFTYVHGESAVFCFRLLMFYKGLCLMHPVELHNAEGFRREFGERIDLLGRALNAGFE